MNADEALRPVGRRGQARDRDRRGIAADDGLGLEHRAEAGEDRALDVFLLGRGLDHEVAIAQCLQCVRRGDAFEPGLALFFGDALAADLPRHVAVDGRDPSSHPVGREIVELDVETGERADMMEPSESRMQEIGLEPVGCTGHEPAGIRQRESTCPATIAAAGLNERQGITMSPIDLSTSYLGLQLANPFIAGASPLSDHLDTVRRLEDGGCAAIVLHSLFEEQISQRDTGRIHHMADAPMYTRRS